VLVVAWWSISIHAFDADDVFDIDLIDTPAEALVQSSCSDAEAQSIAELLIKDLDALCILRQDFYLHTNELNQRSLLDYGLFLPDKFYAHPWQTGTYFFYNQTTRDNFTRKSTALCSYLAIFNDTLLQEIQRRIDNLNPGIVLPDVVPLFKNTTVQERRIGLMFHGMRRWGAYRFRFLFPLYYLESNLFLTPEEIDEIQAEFGITDPADDMKFARQYLIADRIGLGDLRLNLDFPLSSSPGLATKIGVQATIPTACSFRKGLYGSYFKKRCRGPILDFCELFRNLDDLPFLEKQGIAFAQAVLEQLNANLIEVPLGNGGHVGLGVYMRSKTPLNSIIKRPWADKISMRSRMSAEYLFARTKVRNFIQCGDRGFEALGLNRATSVILEEVDEDANYARELVAFFETQLTDKLIPFALPTRVRPGMVFRWMTKYMYEDSAHNWGWYLGTDNWLITREKLSHISIPKCIPQSLNLSIARKPFAYQFGVIGSLFFKRTRNRLIAANAQYNFGSVGIGDDFLISINFEQTF
jgi:hypothetical protein